MRRLRLLALALVAALWAPSAALATIAVAQETCDPATGAMSGSATTIVSSSVTISSGSLLVAVATNASGNTVSSCSDSVNGTTGWSIAKQVTNSPLTLGLAYRENMASGTITVTCTFSASSTLRGIKLLEITGAKTSSSIDGTPAGQFQLNVGTGSDAITSGNLTTAAQPAMVVGVSMNYGNNINPAAGTGFTSTRVDWNTDVGGCRIEYKRVTATGTQAATYTGPSTNSWITLGAAFDEAAGGGGGPRDGQGFFGQPGLAAIGYGRVYELRGDRLIEKGRP